MWNRAIVWVLCVAVFETALCADSYALQPNPPKQTHVAKVLQKLGSGTDALVAMRLQDKSVVSGYVAQAGPESFTVIDPSSGEVRTVPYLAVTRLEGVNVSTGVRVHHAGGFRAGVARGMALLIPGKHVQANGLVSRTTVLVIGIIIGILIAIIVAKA